MFLHSILAGVASRNISKFYYMIDHLCRSGVVSFSFKERETEEW